MKTMSNRIWTILAIGSCACVAISAIAFVVLIGVIVTNAANIFVGVFATILIAESLARKVFSFFTWWWPEQCSPDWLQKNPPLFRLDQLKKRS